MKSKRKPCYASKGLPKVPGKPKGTDIIPAWLTPGEAVLSPGAAEMLGRGNVQALNKAASTMRLGTPQYKAEGEDEMQPDYAMMGNQRAAEILSNSNLFNGREVQAANRYMDPAGLAGGPSLARDQAFLGGTRSLESVNNPADESLRKQIAQAQQGLFGGNRPMRLGSAGDDGTSEGLDAAQEAVGSALGYGRQAAQEAAQEGQGVAQSAIRDANDRARYMSQGGIVQPGYYGMGTSMVLGNRPMYMAGGGMLDDNRLRQGRDPGVVQAMQQYPVQKPVAPQSFANEVRNATNTQRPPDTFDRGIDQIGKGYTGIVQGYRQGGLNPLDVSRTAPAAKQILGGMGDAIAGTYKAAVQAPIEGYAKFARDYANAWSGQQPGRVGTPSEAPGFNPAAATTGLANRGSFGADIAAATGKNPVGRDLTGMETLSRNGDVKPTSELMTARQGTNGNINLNWINQQARDMASRLGTQSNNQPTPIQQSAQNAVYMGGLKMPWNQGDFVSYKDSMGILRAGRAGAEGFKNPMMNLPSMMQDPGMRAAIEAQNSMYTANKSLADANDSNAQAVIRPMQGLNYLGNTMRDTAMTRAQDSQADLNEAILKNPELFSGRLGSKGVPAGAEASLKPQSLNMSDGNIMQFGNQFYRMDPQTNALVNVDMPLSPEDQRLVDQARKLRPDLANIPASTLLETLRNQQNSQTQSSR